MTTEYSSIFLQGGRLEGGCQGSRSGAVKLKKAKTKNQARSQRKGVGKESLVKRCAEFVLGLQRGRALGVRGQGRACSAGGAGPCSAGGRALFGTLGEGRSTAGIVRYRDKSRVG